MGAKFRFEGDGCTLFSFALVLGCLVLRLVGSLFLVTLYSGSSGGLI